MTFVLLKQWCSFLWHDFHTPNFFSFMAEEASVEDSMLRLIWLASGVKWTVREGLAGLYVCMNALGCCPQHSSHTLASLGGVTAEWAQLLPLGTGQLTSIPGADCPARWRSSSFETYRKGEATASCCFTWRKESQERHNSSSFFKSRQAELNLWLHRPRIHFSPDQYSLWGR